jgi:hypothetical protein
VQKFNRDADTFIFLLSTRAGGQGLNLASAGLIIIIIISANTSLVPKNVIVTLLFSRSHSLQIR